MSKGKNEIVLVFASDNSCAMPLAATLKSVAENLRDGRKLIVYILDGGISRHSRKKIISSFSNNNLEIKFIPIENGFLKRLPEPNFVKHVSKMTWARLFMTEYLPERLERVIYLDSDLIVQGDVGELWTIDFEDTCIMACGEKEMPERLKKHLSADIAGEKMLNAGVIVVNLKRWRERAICAKARGLIEAFEEKNELLCADQDILNILFAGKWKALEDSWNVCTPYFEKIQKPNIIHFTTRMKPWSFLWNGHPYGDLFYKYLDMTSWRGWRLNFFRTILQKVKWRIIMIQKRN